eukprot:SAG25_NODE_1161_length_3726_cov_1.685777_2_plen_112_part_00
MVGVARWQAHTLGGRPAGAAAAAGTWLAQPAMAATLGMHHTRYSIGRIRPTTIVDWYTVGLAVGPTGRCGTVEYRVLATSTLVPAVQVLSLLQPYMDMEDRYFAVCRFAAD